MRKFICFIVAAFCVVYLINPTAGLIELIPDNMPFVGNLDEAGATLLLIKMLRELGIDLFKSKSGKGDDKSPPKID
jgi:uncharacterized membrane protein YkvA (DUF1232 family)